MAAGIRTPHPYYPQDLVLDHYVPNTNTVFHTLVYVSIGFLTILVLTILLGYPRRNSTLEPLSEKFAFFWFILCANLHLGFEGYYGIYHATLAGDNSPVAQVWKEYAISDSRYLTSDSFVRVVEAITTLAWGPLSVLCAWSLYHNRPSRHIAQLMLALAHIYGCTLYYCTSIFEGSPHGDPHPYYNYLYFWFFNSFWLLVPVYLLWESVSVLLKAVEAGEKDKSKRKKLQ
ncbi:hypothetical protein EC957_004241 [Mortierella hygrophila]|uniref:EXPERA domain-containing protein n=1 Tax=Mortierella hygrophila TaxID=979708 RepID=A0A9P6K722_9FUNG|nr:hypothetical protein EC957_004241 [Mortierella hygrophila]